MTYTRKPFLRALPHRLRLFVASIALALTALTIGISPAAAEALNARLSGDTAKLSDLIDQADALRCDNPRCLSSIAPINLAISGPRRLRYRVTLQFVKLSTRVIRDQTTDSSVDEARTRPLLLRGSARARHRYAGRSLPVAAAVYRDSPTPMIEISVPRTELRSGRKASGLVVFRAPLTTLRKGASRNVRAEVPSSLAYADRMCGARYAQSVSADSYNAPSAARSTFSTQAVYDVVYLATDYDSQFSTQASCSTQTACKNKILGIINQTATYYENQLGYSFEVAQQFGPTSISSTTIPENLLDSFAEYNSTNRASFMHTGVGVTSSQADIFVYFTGRTLVDDVIGIAYTNVACRNANPEFSAALVQRVSNALDPVTTAHELGHNFNAPHVSSGIMTATLGDSPPQSFASASVSTISTYLSANYNQCRQGVSDDSGTPTPTPTSTPSNDLPDRFDGKPVTVTLRVSGARTRSVRVSTTVTSLNPSCSVKVRASRSSSGSRSGIIVTEFVPSQASDRRSGRMSVGVKQSSGNSYVYFFAEHSCADGSVLEISSVRRFDPNKLRDLRRRITKTSWIKTLRKALP